MSDGWADLSPRESSGVRNGMRWSRSRAVLHWHWGNGCSGEKWFCSDFFLCMALDSNFVTMSFSLFVSNFSSCCPDPAAPNKLSCQGSGMAQGKEGLGRALWRAPAPPCHPQSQRQFCLSLSPLTHIPRAGPGPTCPSVLSFCPVPQGSGSIHTAGSCPAPSPRSSWRKSSPT